MLLLQTINSVRDITINAMTPSPYTDLSHSQSYGNRWCHSKMGNSESKSLDSNSKGVTRMGVTQVKVNRVEV